ncbi:hypothetical protein SPBR_04477 [Sporothrix brasiliensis 5110]|uniref:Uncharacterized protein n=1 Tax=Sporothrix brasiliensis 5110 TaxID=1398154 RepID=A0A0C2IWJ4_9PEZI|nr:uncharacterized protein SPBR_04477 [Sporothrix brasiliensis 5110]KIH93526.1 hypothetical protein SPBR_04477 [Sporothrix brasiliensis 5110]
MRLIIGKLHQAGSFNGDKLIKYYRCLFQAILYRGHDAAFQVIDEVKEMIRTGLNSEGATSWPEDELQFLAAISFNEGIDWFAVGREDLARQWVLSAASLADQCHDGGALKTLISARFGLLNIGDLEVKESIERDIHETADTNGTAPDDDSTF